MRRVCGEISHIFPQHADVMEKVCEKISRLPDVEKIVLFGSYAKGTNREDSDIDVAIIVDRVEGDYFSVNPLLWKLRRQIDDRIEPILVERDFDDADFFGEIQKHGIRIA